MHEDAVLLPGKVGQRMHRTWQIYMQNGHESKVKDEQLEQLNKVLPFTKMSKSREEANLEEMGSLYLKSKM